MARVEALRDQIRAEKLARGITCVGCDDTGRRPTGHYCDCDAGEALAAAERERQRQELAEAWRVWEATLDDRLQIPPRYRGFDVTLLEQEPRWRDVQAWLRRRTPSEGLVLVGPFGCGKTTVAVQALRYLVLQDAHQRASGTAASLAELADDLGRSDGTVLLQPPDVARLGLFTTATGLLESLRPREDGRPDAGMLRRLQEVRYLVLDDLGAERLTAWGADRLYEVLNARYNSQLPVIVTTNLDLGRLAERWNRSVGDESGDRLVNRLLECCALIRWPDDAPNRRLRGDS